LGLGEMGSKEIHGSKVKTLAWGTHFLEEGPPYAHMKKEILEGCGPLARVDKCSYHVPCF